MSDVFPNYSPTLNRRRPAVRIIPPFSRSPDTIYAENRRGRQFWIFRFVREVPSKQRQTLREGNYTKMGGGLASPTMHINERRRGMRTRRLDPHSKDAHAPCFPFRHTLLSPLIIPIRTQPQKSSASSRHIPHFVEND